MGRHAKERQRDPDPKFTPETYTLDYCRRVLESADRAAGFLIDLIDQEFLERLIKESVDAESIMQDCGRIRLMRAAKAAVELYLEMVSSRRTGAKGE